MGEGGGQPGEIIQSYQLRVYGGANSLAEKLRLSTQSLHAVFFFFNHSQLKGKTLTSVLIRTLGKKKEEATQKELPQVIEENTHLVFQHLPGSEGV